MYTEHGCFHLELKGNILFITLEGGWNLETAMAYGKAINVITKDISSEPWAVLTVTDDWELCTPDSELAIVDFVKKAIENGLTREAVVNNKSSIKLEIYGKYKHLKRSSVDNALFERAIFQDVDQALEWLNKDGFGF
jgi:hypothetical protein